MNKSPQYNQQTKPKHFKSSVQSADKTKAFGVYEVEEIFIQHIKTWKLVIAASISDSLKINTIKWATY